jgi:hypothetical protein
MYKFLTSHNFFYDFKDKELSLPSTIYHSRVFFEDIMKQKKSLYYFFKYALSRRELYILGFNYTGIVWVEYVSGSAKYAEVERDEWVEDEEDKR